MKAIMQDDASRFLGIGDTEEEAREDARQWTDELDGTMVVEITKRLSVDIAARGGDVHHTQREDGVYDVA